MTGTVEPRLQEKLERFTLALIDQDNARVIVEPNQAASGFWFGGGNVIEAPDKTLYLVGRYRDAGDSRTGLASGARGLELAVFSSQDKGSSFQKILSFDKASLDVGDRKVLSIEGSALVATSNGFELYVSSEKDGVGYPESYAEFLKPNTGVWSIDRLAAPAIDGLREAEKTCVLECDDPLFLHIKDPFVYDLPDGGMMLLFCSHPFCWTSSNTGYALRRQSQSDFSDPVFDFFPRGFAWDVAITRGTAVLPVPKVGAFRDLDATLMFYDGGECVRLHGEHQHAASRPRGYSCEELGGVAYTLDASLSRLQRLSVDRPLFISPHGTGCSRYVDVLPTDDGYYATWQQSQPDGSQPLVMNFLSRDEASALLE